MEILLKKASCRNQVKTIGSVLTQTVISDSMKTSGLPHSEEEVVDQVVLEDLEALEDQEAREDLEDQEVLVVLEALVVLEDQEDLVEAEDN